MKSSRLKYEYRDNASNLHKAVGDCLRSSKLFGGFKIYQEYPVNKINPSYKNAAHRVDWVIKDLQLIIECHGIQHYKSTTWPGMSPQQAIDNYRNQIIRDRLKQEAAEEIGWSYIVIPYTEEKNITDALIWDLYQKTLPFYEIEKEFSSKSERRGESDASDRHLGITPSPSDKEE